MCFLLIEKEEKQRAENNGLFLKMSHFDGGEYFPKMLL
jgi:hypothetical protein